MNDRNASTGYLGSAAQDGWLTTTDHKRIALMFMGWTLGALLVGLLLSVLPLVRSLGAMQDDPTAVLRALTYERLIQVFLFLAPAIPSTLGLFLLPLQLGAPNMSLPSASRWSLRLYASGLVLVLISLLVGGVSFGWTMATPLSLTAPGTFGPLALGLALVGLSWFATGVNIIVTVHHGRRPGLGFFQMTVMAWSLYLGAFILVGAGLVFAIIVLYLAGARATGQGLFAPGSDPLLWLNYFWLVARPAALGALIPATGVVFDVVAGISRKAVAGYRIVVGALIALLALVLVTWGIHLAGWGQAPEATFAFSVLNALGAIPVAMLAYLLLATLHRGAVACAAPTTFTVAFLLHTGIALAMGLFLGNGAVAGYLNTSMFATVQFDYLVWGSGLAALLAGLHYWWPKITGRQPNQQVGRFGGFLFLIGVNLTFLPRLFQGIAGVPVDQGAFEPGPTSLGEASGLGWLFLFFSLIVVLGNLIAALYGPARAGDDPWGAGAPEWRTSSPPPVDNFRQVPEAGEPYGT